MIDGAGGQVGQLDAGRVDLGLAAVIGESQDRIGIRDIEIVADQHHAERRVQPLDEDAPGIGDAVAVGIAKQRDAVGARRAGAGPLLRLFIDETLDALAVIRLWRGVGLGDQHIAVRQHVERARMVELFGEGIHRHAVLGLGLAVGRPANHRRNIDRWDPRILRRRQVG